MKKRKITVNIDTTYKYVQLWNGIFNLTNKELQILSTFIDVQNITDEVNLCSVKNKREVARMVGIKDPNTLNNYIKKLKDKGALIFNKGSYSVNKLLNPNVKHIEIIIN